MHADIPRAGVALGCALALVLGASLGGGVVSLGAPISGEAWGPAYASDGSFAGSVDRAVTGPETVENPHGEATVRYDEDGVPHVTASNGRALAFAVGYVQARDRLFQMDLQRRLMAGNLSAAFGADAVDSDRFHRQVGFEEAARASWEAVRETEAGPRIEAYAAGVNRYADTRPLPLEFQLNDYEPTRWEPTDTLLVGKLIAWGLTGDFRDLRQRAIERRLPEATDLYPDQLDHDAAILDRAVLDSDGAAAGRSVDESPSDPVGTESPESRRLDGARPAEDFAGLYAHLSRFETEPGIGSNSWVVSGAYTESGNPLLANDPHLQLTVPPVWYEQHLVVEGDPVEGMNVRGVALPGFPFVVIGQTEDVAWGFTNVGADQVDLYTYERPSPDTYRYREETREVERRTETLQVSDGDDVEVTVERTVHGPLIEREGSEVGVAWVGLAGTREALAIHRLNLAGSVGDVDEALRFMDSPTQNLVAADRDGRTYFRLTGRYPVRTVDGERVTGARVFDGSAGEGEWVGWEPYGQADWDGLGFHAYEEVPHVEDPSYLATANQRTTDDPPFYISHSTGYADPYRGARIYDRLEARIESDEPVTREWNQELQRDVRSEAAAHFVPVVLESLDAMSPQVRLRALSLRGWDRRMTRDSEAALVYALFREHYPNATFFDEYDAAGLDQSHYPKYWTLGELSADSEWFDDRRTPETETRADVVARAMRRAVEEMDRKGYRTYADYNVVDLDHPFPVAALDYPEASADGSPFTVFNFRVNRETQAGSSWRMVVDWDGPSVGVIPGGQSGSYFSAHYADQLDEWRTGEYHEFTMDVEGTRTIVFESGGEGE